MQQTKGDKHTANYRCELFTGGVVKVRQGKPGSNREGSLKFFHYVFI